MKKKTLIFAVILVLALLSTACGGSYSPPPSSATAGAEAAPSASAAPAPSGGSKLATTQGDSGAFELNEYEYQSGESYLEIDENAERSTEQESMLTFSLKVDTASYTNVQRYIESGNLPPSDAVRTEELINYFDYDKRLSPTDGPFGIYTEVGPSPFDAEKKMAFIRVKTEDIDKDELPSSNLTFLIDTSGSMNSYDKLPLLKEAFSLLVETLDEDDSVSIVTYAGSSAVVLDSVSGGDKAQILRAIDRLEAGGSTAGADGIRTAYKLAEKNFMRNGNNRVILATDGDFNVGISNINELERFIGQKRDSGVYLSILGFGTGNIRDDIMETLSKNGNGNYSYINSVNTAKKVLVGELGSNMFTVADDVKAQVEFNPTNVKSYRLIGYENRRMSNRDFNDDSKDAGEIGIGTDVVVMFELELQGSGSSGHKYSAAEASEDTPQTEFSDELFEVRIRYKNPGGDKSRLIEKPFKADDAVKTGSSDFNFACSVAAFGHLLRDSGYSGSIDIEDVIGMAKNNLGIDADGYREEFLGLLREYSKLI